MQVNLSLPKPVCNCTCGIEGNRLCLNSNTYRISKNDFEKVYRMLPINGPGEIGEIVRGPSYVWAILHDRRISEGKKID
jgi:hypothetical protein